MKAKNILLLTVLLLVVGGGIFIYRIFGSLDQIIQAGIEKYGSEITQTDISLAGVSLDLANGQAALQGFNMTNPQGFKTEYAVKFEQVKVTLDIDSITKDPIIIKEILIQNPTIIYELASDGSNIDRILANIAAYTGSGQEQTTSDNGPKLIIEDLYIKDGQVSISHSALKGKMLTSALPDIHLEDIGKEDEGATPAEVANEIMSSIKSGASSAASAVNLDKLTGAIRHGTSGAIEKSKAVGSSVKEGVGKAVDKLKGLFQ